MAALDTYITAMDKASELEQSRQAAVDLVRDEIQQVAEVARHVRLEKRPREQLYWIEEYAVVLDGKAVARIGQESPCSYRLTGYPIEPPPTLLTVGTPTSARALAAFAYLHDLGP